MWRSSILIYYIDTCCCGTRGRKNGIFYPFDNALHSWVDTQVKFQNRIMKRYLLFWYQVFTWVSVRLSLAASSILSWTDKYFCLSKLVSKVCSWESVNAVRAFLCFFEKLDELECVVSPSSSEIFKIFRYSKNTYF